MEKLLSIWIVIISNMGFFPLFNKKVLLRESKGHTDSRVGRRRGVWTDRQTRVKTLPSPVL